MKIKDDVMYIKTLIAIRKLECIKSRVKTYNCQDKLDILYQLISEFEDENFSRLLTNKI